MSRILPGQPPILFRPNVWTKDQQDDIVRIWQDLRTYAGRTADPLTTSTVVATTTVITPTIVTQQIGPIRFAQQYTGADDAARIAAATASLPATGGEVWASEGNQTWSTNPFTGVTIPVVFRLGAGTTTIPSSMTIPSNVEVKLPDGAIFSVASGQTFSLRVSDASSLSQHFTGPGSIILRNGIVHTRWFDNGTHTDVPFQLAVNACQAGMVRVNDVLTLGATVVVRNKAITIDCGGIAMFSSALPGQGGFLWNGPANQPMLEIISVATIIQNARFYGKSSARPRSAISFIYNSSVSGGVGSNIVRNVHIGGLGADTGYNAWDSLVNGIWIGDTYDSGMGGVNDHIQIESSRIWGYTNAGIRQGSIQNSLGHFREVNFSQGVYAFWLVSTISLHSCFAASMSGPVIYVPPTDDYAQSVSPEIWGHDVESEQCGRYLSMDGNALVRIFGGGFASSSSMAADLGVILGKNNNAQSVYISDFIYQDLGGGSSWKITLQASDASHAAFKILEYHGYGPQPTIDMLATTGVEALLASRSLAFLDATSISNYTSNQFPYSRNVLIGSGSEYSTYDDSKFHIPTRGLRVGDSQNTAGAWEISTASFILKPVNGTTSVTATGLIPANVLVLGVTSRNLNGIVITAGTLRLGSGTSAAKWNASLAVAGNTSTNVTNWDFTQLPGGTTNPSPYWTKTAEDVVASVSGGTFGASSGWIVVTAYFIKLLAPPAL